MANKRAPHYPGELSMREVAERMGISIQSVHQLANRDRFRTHWIGGARYVREIDLQAYLESPLRRKSPSPPAVAGFHHGDPGDEQPETIEDLVPNGTVGTLTWRDQCGKLQVADVPDKHIIDIIRMVIERRDRRFPC